ncbi:MAG: uracil-DNA glycosylase family protein [Pseudomonadales bacterium]|uniref:Uracil-DNA glycosylase superfamily protein n=1 Tax=Oleiphilus messinensis TaxID=141451 RepID=A0A1Y0IBK3_9GAMM|nr:uracil-DNA glycosylase family protein [Oleiphilus messinensis]ARU57640.1 uracil-DNA glycosylase superfamily protein [Oleiphilus messinensis]MCG8610470.1 uracil-DNA glycosylase family protein [Pseudomonadales bacterium]
MSKIIATDVQLPELLSSIRECRLCEAHLEPRPVLRASATARLLIVGQAPGKKVHLTGIPWNDPSGDRLRLWCNLDKKSFYDECHVAIIPAAFCYPGKGKSGDLPPPPICADTWHGALLAQLPNIELTLLVGQYAQKWYLGARRKATLTDTVRCFDEYISSGFFPLPHPSPRNTLWLKRNPWFEQDVVPALQDNLRRFE